MTLLLYAIADRHQVTPPGVLGLGARPVRAVGHGELAALVGECPAPPEPTHATLLQFEETVERLMGDGTVLPARFGTMLAGERAATELLTTRQGQLVAALKRVGGAVELGVRAGWTDDEPASAPPAGGSAGTAYLLGRLDHRRRARRIADDIDAVLGDLARERFCRILSRPESQVSAAYLVARPHVDEFLGRCRRLEETLTDAQVVCTGPWPPYSFVTQEET